VRIRKTKEQRKYGKIIRQPINGIEEK